ncbi:MAG TPA: TIR domain-containing protein [Steroidobacteraceae bacterium]
MTDSPRAVFLSYASEDADAALRICEALRAAGIEVWLDRSELRGGDAWDATIRRQIRSCSLFIPLISASSRLRAEGYFRLEWKLAVDRSFLMAGDKAFLVPVVIDGTHEGDARVPEKFWEVQWTRLPGGEPSPTFIERVTRLLAPQPLRPPWSAAGSAATASGTAPPGAGASAAAASAQPFEQKIVSARKPGRPRFGLIALWAAVILAVGYILLDRFRATPPATAPASRTTSAPMSEQSIAILPFVDMSEKKDQEYFSDGISEELIDLVTRGTTLRVPARTSSFFFKGKQVTIDEVAKALGVTHVLEGSIRKSGNTIRVTVQLIRANDGYHLWSATYDRELKDIFKVQDDIAAAVVEVLKSRLAAPAAVILGRPANPEAYSEYLLGKQLFNRGNPAGFKGAIEAFRRAIGLDPSYAAAYAGLATAEAYWADNGGEPADVERALTDADQAIALAPKLADGYVARGWLRISRKWDWAGAQADFEKALQLDAGDSTTLRRYGSLMAALGRVPEGISAAKKAIDADPLSNAAWGNLGVYYNGLGQYTDARKALKRALDINPDSVYAHWNLGLTELLEGHADKALAAFPESNATAFHQAGVGMAQHSLHHAPQSQAALDALLATMTERWAYQIAEVYAWRGQLDQAFDWLQRAYTQRDGGLIQVKYDPLLKSLRSDARYQVLLRQMNLPP